MATTVTYKGQTLTTVENETKVLETKGTWVEDDFTLTDVSGGGGGTWHKDDGKTHLHINIYNDVYLPVNLCFTQTVNNGNIIDWGDGTSETITGTSRQLLAHTYAEQGKYDISITNTSGYYYFGSDSSTGGYIFQKTGGNGNNAKFAQLNNILEKVELGQGWDISKGRQFSMCMSLSEVYISTKPSQISIGFALFQGSKSFRKLEGIDGWDSGITSCGNYAFQKCGLATSYIPPNVTTIPYGYMDSENASLSTLFEITLHEGITDIMNNAFKLCQYVPEIIIPSTVTHIGSEAFSQSYGCHAVHLKPTTPPALDNANAFSTNNGNTYNQVMYVPKGSLSAYQTATNWSTYASYMVEEEPE